MFIRLRKSNRRLKAKGYYRVNITFKWLRFISYKKIINIIYNRHSFINKLLLSYINTFKESSLNGLLKVLALFNLHEYALGEFLKRFYAKRSCNGFYKRQSGALLAESIIEFYNKKIINIK
jgi:hypothetical protein